MTINIVSTRDFDNDGIYDYIDLDDDNDEYWIAMNSREQMMISMVMEILTAKI